MTVYTLDDLRAKIASNDYGAELCLMHAMINIGMLEAQIESIRAAAQANQIRMADLIQSRRAEQAARIYAGMDASIDLEREHIASLFDVPTSISGEAEDWSRAAAARIRQDADE